ncbi:UDP-2,4-diacetamido-2,4,6-trideoxy-beta-L-altropyranose hydrolase [Bordetella hinzii]|uniref:UDP-2,4-diacetamido-2,4, 6-trideoxy-beta-L-altropyranose hydrolase n=1 Tax=Bordetella hinzii TaxID=103855 RepID=UPI0039FD901C
MSWRVAFRADASRSIGTGHVMRCLTLARYLREKGADCRFVSRLHDGHLVDFVRMEGFAVHALPAPSASAAMGTLAHSAWLGVEQQLDAAQTRQALKGIDLDWVVIDHYGLDAEWEARIQARAKLVIDDLADRVHQCQLLLDQTLGRRPADYRGLVPPSCTVLAGTDFALLRPEFAESRDASLYRRRTADGIKQILVTMGGVDEFNVSETVLDVLDESPVLPDDCRVCVVLGTTARWLDSVRNRARAMRLPTHVVVGVSDMAARMAASDLAIGAAGSTSWERACLGLPTAMVVLADNQVPSAKALSQAGAARLLGTPGEVSNTLPRVLAELSEPAVLRQLVHDASRICDGLGTWRLINMMECFLDEAGKDGVRRMRDEDLTRVLGWRNHPEVRRYMYTTHEITLHEHTAWFARASQDPAKHLLVYEQGGAPAGFASLSVDSRNNIAEWGFYVAPDAPKGTGRQLGRAVLKYAFETVGVHKVCGEALDFNERSVQFHERLGFKREGVLRDQHFDGKRYHSIVAFGMLRHEWQSK